VLNPEPPRSLVAFGRDIGRFSDEDRERYGRECVGGDDEEVFSFDNVLERSEQDFVQLISTVEVEGEGLSRGGIRFVIGYPEQSSACVASVCPGGGVEAASQCRDRIGNCRGGERKPNPASLAL